MEMYSVLAVESVEEELSVDDVEIVLNVEDVFNAEDEWIFEEICIEFSVKEGNRVVDG